MLQYVHIVLILTIEHDGGDKDMNYKGYEKLSDGDDTTVDSHKLPATFKFVTYNDRGDIEYTAIGEFQPTTIKKNRIPDFLSELRKAKEPWVQMAWSPLFEKMSGLDTFEASLSDNRYAAMDYWLIKLAICAGNLQVSKVGSDQSKTLCADSDELLKLYATVAIEIDKYKSTMEEHDKHQGSRHYAKRKQEAIKMLNDGCSAAIEPILKKYKENRDVRNICLNILAICSVIGLVGLFLKNVSRVYHGKKLGLFQFEQAHSKRIEPLEALSKTMEDTASSSQVQGGTSYFSGDPKDIEDSCKELSEYLADFKASIDEWQPSDKPSKMLVSNLNHIQSKLDKILKPKQSEGISDFLEEWVAAINWINMEQNQLKAYPTNIASKLLGLKVISEQFAQDLAALHPQNIDDDTTTLSTHSLDSNLS